MPLRPMGTDATAPARPQASKAYDQALDTGPQAGSADGSAPPHDPQPVGQNVPDFPPHAQAHSTALAVGVDAKAYARLEKVRKRVSSPAMRIREDMQSHLETVLPQLVEDAQAGRLNRLQFADFLAKYGLGTNSTLQIVSPDVIARLEHQVSLIASRDEWSSQELLEALRDIWS